MPGAGREGNPGLHSCWCQEVLPESNPDAPHCLRSVFCGGTRHLQLRVPVPKPLGELGACAQALGHRRPDAPGGQQMDTVRQ